MKLYISQFKQEGTALLLVMWSLSLLSIIALSYALTVRNELILVTNLVRGSEARALAEAGIWVGVHSIVNGSIQQSTKDGTPFEMSYAGSVIKIAIEDETGRIDLNTAGEELLRGLVENSAIPRQLQSKVVDQIIDWRDRDSDPRKEGAERREYMAAGISDSPKNGSFNTVEELNDVLSITPEIYDSLEPKLTVHSQEAGINYLTADRQVLLAVPGITVSQADWIYQNRHAGAVNIFNSLPNEPRRYLISKESSVYRISSQAKSGKVVSNLQAVVKLGGLGRSFSILEWREG